jgi:hypothetical protein
MENKARYKTFWFDFNSNSEDNKEFIKTINFEYMMFYEAEDTKIISGYIRFKNQKFQKSVETKTFLNKATIKRENRSEKKIIDHYSKIYKISEYGTPTNQGARNDIIKPEKIIKLKDEEIAKKDEEIAKKDEEIDNLIKDVKNYKNISKYDQIDKLIKAITDNNNSKKELLKQLKENISTIAINNYNTTNKNIFVSILQNLEFEIHNLVFSDNYTYLRAISKLFNNTYKKLESDLITENDFGLV